MKTHTERYLERIAELEKLVAAQKEEIEKMAFEIAELEALASRMAEALDDIVNLHEKDLEEIEKRTGFLGWTCCGQKTKLAQKVLFDWKAYERGKK